MALQDLKKKILELKSLSAQLHKVWSADQRRKIHKKAFRIFDQIEQEVKK